MPTPQEKLDELKKEMKRKITSSHEGICLDAYIDRAFSLGVESKEKSLECTCKHGAPCTKCVKEKPAKVEIEELKPRPITQEELELMDKPTGKYVCWSPNEIGPKLNELIRAFNNSQK